MKRHNEPPTKRAVAAHDAFMRSTLPEDHPGRMSAEEYRELAESSPAARRDNPEARDQEALTRAVLTTRWYAPGYRHIAQERASRGERMTLAGRGVVAGEPDVRLEIPGGIDLPFPSYPMRVVVELKALERGRKKRLDEQWWLDWRPKSAESSRYGLRGSQARRLQELYYAGYRTFVAYGWEEALFRLDQAAGPRPSELPEIWTRYDHWQRSDAADLEKMRRIVGK